MVELSSISSIIKSEAGMHTVYTTLEGVPEDIGTSLNEVIQNSEWVESLSLEDKRIVFKLISSPPTPPGL
jgi:hypothetical protein